jgi:protein-disulfide isomerase
MSWELIGIIGVVAVLVVGGLYAALGGGGDAAPEGIQAPSFAAVSDGIETGVTDDGRPYMGSAAAPVTVYEFADFQCPHCKDFSQISATDFKNKYVSTGQAKLVWVNYPIMGDESTHAAKGAVCATEQGQFWAYHDWVFANQPIQTNSGRFSSDGLAEIVAEIPAIDSAAFQTCMDAAETASRVQEDQAFGRDEAVESTPSFKVGDTIVVGGDVPKLNEAVGAAQGG